jgi:hypothetical protein
MRSKLFASYYYVINVAMDDDDWPASVVLGGCGRSSYAETSC